MGGCDTGQESEWGRWRDGFTGMGGKLAITECDVNDKNRPADPAIRDREVAALGRRYLDMMLDYPQVDEGIRGMAFIDNVVKSSQSEQKWTEHTI